MNLLITLLLLVLALPAKAIPADDYEEFWEMRHSGDSISLRDMRMKKRIGIGFSAAGPLSVMGVEVDVNLTESLSVSMGFGTGVDYSTLMVKGRYFLIQEWISPYLALGFARWWSDGTAKNIISPSFLQENFLKGKNLTEGFAVDMIFPAVGAEFMHPLGVGFFAELQYFISLRDFKTGVYGGMGAHWYF